MIKIRQKWVCQICGHEYEQNRIVGCSADKAWTICMEKKLKECWGECLGQMSLYDSKTVEFTDNFLIVFEEVLDSGEVFGI